MAAPQRGGDPRPQLWIFAGPNGAGKSTLAARIVRGRLPIVNPDVIARTLPPGRDGGARVERRTRVVSRRLPDWVERAVPAELRTPDPA